MHVYMIEKSTFNNEDSVRESNGTRSTDYQLKGRIILQVFMDEELGLKALEKKKELMIRQGRRIYDTYNGYDGYKDVRDYKEFVRYTLEKKKILESLED